MSQSDCSRPATVGTASHADSPWAHCHRKSPPSSYRRHWGGAVVDLTEDDSGDEYCDASCSKARLSLSCTTPPSDGSLATGAPRTREVEAHSSAGATKALPTTTVLMTTCDGRERPRSAYLRHFEDAMDAVMRARPDYARLFTPEEREWAHKFTALSCASRNLYVRLFQRKGPWFRVDQMLGYDEVGSGTPLWVRRRSAAAAVATAGGGGGGGGGEGNVDERERPASSEQTLLRHVRLPRSPFKCQSESPSAGLVSANAAPDSTRGYADRDGQPCDAVGARLDSGATHESHEAVAAAVVDEATRSVGLSSDELTVLHTEVQAALQELVTTGLLDPLPSEIGGPGHELEKALAAARCCLKVPEVKTLLKRVGGGRASSQGQAFKAPGRDSPPSARSGRQRDCSNRTSNIIDAVGAPLPRTTSVTGSGRDAMIDALRQRLTKQQTLWDARLPLTKEIGRLISAAVAARGVDVKGSGREHVAGCPADGNCHHDGTQWHWLVCIEDGPRLVFKRALRLLYLTCNTSALSSGDVGAASVRGGGTAPALSTWSPGLSVAFGKARYAEVSMSCDSCWTCVHLSECKTNNKVPWTQQCCTVARVKPFPLLS